MAELMEIFKGIFGEEAINYDTFEQKLKDTKDLKLVNLSDGGYVDIGKFTGKEKDVKTLQDKLDEANKEIQKFKEMDIDSIKKAADDWKKKYEDDTAALKEEMNKREVASAAKDFLGKYKFTSESAKRAATSDFINQKLQFQDGTFLGGEDFMKQMKEKDPGAFVKEETETVQKAPTVVKSTVTPDAPKPGSDKEFHFNFRGVRPQRKEE